MLPASVVDTNRVRNELQEAYGTAYEAAVYRTAMWYRTMVVHHNHPNDSDA
ncbi:hypothetical protein FB471_4476 [Amycolatopsis cihanbeyliensis]|uniref:Uncharacterized protein n=1 Tax=Amycolatopsis cihanbeyliensis TaxID=1128664 RepID=A0A542DNJ2_AMYCI|nr:hypothetical protein FB471_4476 [Amycolatopsis cihanbeyliensis]